MNAPVQGWKPVSVTIRSILNKGENQMGTDQKFHKQERLADPENLLQPSDLS
jgi:hypothetical protein